MRQVAAVSRYPGAGTTTCLLALSATLTASCQRTLLVEQTDRYYPILADVAGRPDRWLEELPDDADDLFRFVRPLTPRLDVLPVPGLGHEQPHRGSVEADELTCALRANARRRVRELAADRYDVILFDLGAACSKGVCVEPGAIDTLASSDRAIYVIGHPDEGSRALPRDQDAVERLAEHCEPVVCAMDLRRQEARTFARHHFAGPHPVMVPRDEALALWRGSMLLHDGQSFYSMGRQTRRALTQLAQLAVDDLAPASSGQRGRSRWAWRPIGVRGRQRPAGRPR